MNPTLEYYEKNAAQFATDTINVDFKQVQDLFISRLPQHAIILDFGCGAGRDTKYFLSQRFDVEAVDGSAELCRKASEYTGIIVKQMLFQELDAEDKYDGIWACSSILHLPKRELEVVFRKMLAALKEHGVIYTSFKYGDFEGVRNGRYFTDFTYEAFQEYAENIHGMEIEEQWITVDARPGRESEKWLNLIMRKL